MVFEFNNNLTVKLNCESHIKFTYCRDASSVCIQFGISGKDEEKQQGNDRWNEPTDE